MYLHDLFRVKLKQLRRVWRWVADTLAAEMRRHEEMLGLAAVRDTLPPVTWDNALLAVRKLLVPAFLVTLVLTAIFWLVVPL